MGAWAQRDSEWLEEYLAPDDPKPTHRIVWTPTFEIDLAIPPWQDPEDALANLTMGWNDAVPEEDGWFYFDGHTPCWVICVTNEGSAAHIEVLASTGGTDVR